MRAIGTYKSMETGACQREGRSVPNLQRDICQSLHLPLLCICGPLLCLLQGIQAMPLMGMLKMDMHVVISIVRLTVR